MVFNLEIFENGYKFGWDERFEKIYRIQKSLHTALIELILYLILLNILSTNSFPELPSKNTFSKTLSEKIILNK